MWCLKFVVRHAAVRLTKETFGDRLIPGLSPAEQADAQQELARALQHAHYSGGLLAAATDLHLRDLLNVGGQALQLFTPEPDYSGTGHAEQGLPVSTFLGGAVGASLLGNSSFSVGGLLAQQRIFASVMERQARDVARFYQRYGPASGDMSSVCFCPPVSRGFVRDVSYLCSGGGSWDDEP